MAFSRGELRELFELAVENDDFEFLAELELERREPVGVTYDRNTPKFDLDRKTDAQIKNLFRFRSAVDVRRLIRALGLPAEIRVANGAVTDVETAVCLTLRRLAYPCRLSDLEPLFGRNKEVLSMLINETLFLILERHIGKMTDLDQPWLTVAKLQHYADAIHAQGAMLKQIWAFIDGTFKATCRPGLFQRKMYSGHKRLHGYKYQGVTTPDGIIVNMHGPIEASRHDAYMLAESGLVLKMEQRALLDRDGTPFAIYGDPAYPLKTTLMVGFKGANVTADQALFNKSMSSARQAVEWEFGKVVREFAFLDFKKNQKIFLQPVALHYFVGVLLSNCHTCLYGCQTSRYFGVQPPTLEAYLY